MTAPPAPNVRGHIGTRRGTPQAHPIKGDTMDYGSNLNPDPYTPSAILATAAAKAQAKAALYTSPGDSPRMREFYLRKANRLAGLAHLQTARGL
jgi:hypothetical protein